MMIRKSSVALVAALSAFALVGSACSDDSTSSDSASSTSATTSSATSQPMTSQTEAAPAGLVGAGCAAYAEQVPDGPGSLAAMAEQPVSAAAASNPLLTTLTAALTGGLNPEVNLAETLDSGEFTIFAPVDSAFAAVDPATVETLKTDSALLTTILTYHAVPGRLSADAVAGTQKTVEGSDVTVTRNGDEITVNDATVVCGGVETANATVYLIDGVLIPPTVPAS